MDGEEHSEDYDGPEDPENAVQSGESFWCSLCDDGGKLLFCDGPCLRSFHACLSEQEKEEGKTCRTLGYTEQQFKAIENDFSTWLCRNCKHGEQLCFVCRKLGKSEGEDKEVFNCETSHCGHFFHPMCVARALTKDALKQKSYAIRIKLGKEIFICPSHKCHKCREFEDDGTDPGRQFAKCRQCPLAWHIQCLPKNVLFEGDPRLKSLGLPQRAWKVPVGDRDDDFRVGIYCEEHIFPIQASDMVKFPLSHVVCHKRKEQTSYLPESTIEKSKKAINGSFAISKRAPALDMRAPLKKYKPKTSVLDIKKDSISQLKIRSDLDVRKVSSVQHSNVKQPPPKSKAVAGGSRAETPQLPSEEFMKQRIDEIIARSKEVKTLEDVKKDLRIPSHYSDKRLAQDGGKFIYDGELSSILNSIPKALNVLKNGGKIEEAKCLCPVKSILQLDRVERAMKLFLNPCLHGQRYTSFGRHFTVKEKLVEVVDRLQWYIDDGDMVTDFCCGANDFSIEVSDKLVKAGKRNCEFKNFDILAPKNNFHFEQRDWFTVQPSELAVGDRLIIGLNPPFGVIANNFIDWTLKFRPKIVLLIVPDETKRLEPDYSLIWSDSNLLSGKSFYLPGSVNTDSTVLEDWNKKAPPLYLWSRVDCAEKHRQIALLHGHIKDPTSDMMHPLLNHEVPLNTIHSGSESQGIPYNSKAVQVADCAYKCLAIAPQSGQGKAYHTALSLLHQGRQLILTHPQIETTSIPFNPEAVQGSPQVDGEFQDPEDGEFLARNRTGGERELDPSDDLGTRPFMSNNHDTLHQAKLNASCKPVGPRKRPFNTTGGMSNESTRSKKQRMNSHQHGQGLLQRSNSIMRDEGIISPRDALGKSSKNPQHHDTDALKDRNRDVETGQGRLAGGGICRERRDMEYPEGSANGKHLSSRNMEKPCVGGDGFHRDPRNSGTERRAHEGEETVELRIPKWYTNQWKKKAGRREDLQRSEGKAEVLQTDSHVAPMPHRNFSTYDGSMPHASSEDPEEDEVLNWQEQSPRDTHASEYQGRNGHFSPPGTGYDEPPSNGVRTNEMHNKGYGGPGWERFTGMPHVHPSSLGGNGGFPTGFQTNGHVYPYQNEFNLPPSHAYYPYPHNSAAPRHPSRMIQDGLYNYGPLPQHINQVFYTNVVPPSTGWGGPPPVWHIDNYS